MDNIEPLVFQTGESMVVKPNQTLKFIKIIFKIIKHLIMDYCLYFNYMLEI
jgi:hypothetical protein